MHIDGDCPWSKRTRSENAKKFDRLVVQKVRTILSHHLDSQDLVDRALRRLLVFMPFYSVESWLYQNNRTGRAICEEMGSPETLVSQLESWTRDPKLLDEVQTPKRVCALGDGHNLILATQAWPSQKVYDLGLSFANTVDGFAACGALLYALEDLHQ